VDRSGFTLRDMVEWGILHPTQATDTLVDLLAELRLVTEVPVLVAIDGLNHLYEATPYPSEGRIVGPHELSIAAALRCLDGDGFKTCVTRCAAPPRQRNTLRYCGCAAVVTLLRLRRDRGLSTAALRRTRACRSTHGMRRGLVLSAVDQRPRDTMKLFDEAHVPLDSRLRVPMLTRLETSGLLQAYARTGRFGALDSE